MNFLTDNSQTGFGCGRMPKKRSLADLAPARRAIQHVRNHLRDVLDNVAQWPRAIDVFEDAAAPLFQLRDTAFLRCIVLALCHDGRCLLSHSPAQHPDPEADCEYYNKEE